MFPNSFYQIAVIASGSRLRQQLLMCLRDNDEQCYSVLNFSTYGEFIESDLEKEVSGLIVSSDVLYGSPVISNNTNQIHDLPIICIQDDSNISLHSSLSTYRAFTETIAVEDLTPVLLKTTLKYILELRSVVQEMKSLQNVAEIADRANNRLFEYMSHELTSPLQSAKTLQESIEYLDDISMIKDNAKVTVVAVTHVLDTINNVSEYIRTSKNLVEMQSEEFNMIPMIEDLMSLFQPHAENKNITVDFEYFSADDCMYIGDKARIRQVLVNILKNAVKYTDQGSIRIRAQRGRDSLCISVTDTGMGMCDTKIDEVLTRSAPQPAAEFDGGLGIGLKLSREILNLLGGYLTVHSEEGAGSTFTIVLPNDYYCMNEETSLVANMSYY